MIETGYYPMLIADSGKGSSVANYYSTVLALTPNATQTEASIPQGVDNTPFSLLFSPFLIYGSVILFFALFLGAIVVQIINKTLDMKRTLTSMAVAFVIASIPVSLKTALQVTQLQSRAGADAVPRNVRISQTGLVEMTVEWETQAEKIGSLRFGPAPLIENTAKVVIADMGKKKLKHTARLEGLIPDVDYELEILSGTDWYSDKGKPLKFRLRSP